MVKLGSEFNYDNTRPDGSDLRFTQVNGTDILDYLIESWNPGGDSVLWVKAPVIAVDEQFNYIWMYFGNPYAQDSQNSINTFYLKKKKNI